MVSRTLFHSRAGADRSEPSERWYLVRETDGSYWVEHAREPAAATDDPVTISIVRVGRFFAHTDDSELLGRLRAALARAVM